MEPRSNGQAPEFSVPIDLAVPQQLRFPKFGTSQLEVDLNTTDEQVGRTEALRCISQHGMDPVQLKFRVRVEKPSQSQSVSFSTPFPALLVVSNEFVTLL